MKFYKFLYALICLLNIGTTHAKSSANLPKFATAMKVPSTLSISLQKTPYSKIYADTTCVDFTLFSTSKKIGFMCQTSDPKLLADVGVSDIDSNVTSILPLHLEQNLVVATVMSQYPMESFDIPQMTSYASIIDCDLNNGPVYRATGSCHVTIATTDNKKYFYSNFIIEDHVNRRVLISVDTIKKIWGSLASLQ